MQVVRFILDSARTFEVPGAGRFIDGVLDVPASDYRAVDRARFLVGPYGGREYGTVDSTSPKPSLPAAPLPPSPDPFPQYPTRQEVADDLGDAASLIGGAARAAFVPRDEYVPGAGGSGGGALVFQQSTPSASWSISHALGRLPAVDLFVGGQQVDADVEVTSSSVHVSFPAPVAGTAVLV